MEPKFWFTSYVTAEARSKYGRHDKPSEPTAKPDAKKEMEPRRGEHTAAQRQSARKPKAK